MAKLKDAIKNLGIAVNEKEPEGYYVTDMLKSFGTDLTGTQIEGKGITDVLNNIADNYSGGGQAVLIEKTITENGEYSAASDEADGYSKVNINVIPNVTTLKGYLDIMHEMSNMFLNYRGTTLEGIIAYDDTENVTAMYQTFKNCEQMVTIPTLNTSNVTNLNAAFSDCYKLTNVPLSDTSKVTNMQSAFNWCADLTVIPALDFSNVTNFFNTFDYCNNLEEFHAYGMKTSFDIHYSTKFTESALVEVLNNLATVQTSQTLTLGSTNLAKLTEDEKAIATNKGWSLI